jgi:hypothetical protein
MATEKKTWIEVALNGPWGRDKQRHMPVSVKEIVEDQDCISLASLPFPLDGIGSNQSAMRSE